MNTAFKQSFTPRLSLLAMALIQASICHGESSPPTAPYFYTPRITGQFLAGGNQQLGGFADGMLPLLQRPSGFFFADGSVLLGQSNRHTFSGGLGYRGIYDTPMGAGIAGAFAFVDYYHTALSNTFWQLNPGVEWLTTAYEARLQGYIPVSDKTSGYANALASNLPANVLKDSGRGNQLFGATGHRVFDTPIALIEQVGPGVELEVGAHVNLTPERGAWLRVGGYHYNFNGVPNVNGVQANIEVSVNQHVSLLMQNNYDNQNKNRFSVGLRANFGGSSSSENTLTNRMTATIIRHQARQSYGEKDPTRLNFKASGASFNLFDNAWFFSPSGSYPAGENTTRANCTAENPCLTLDSPTAAQIQVLAPGASLLFETGNYIIPQGNSNNMRWANLQNGQTVLGRNLGWFTPASESNRPRINGGLFWGDNSSDTLANGVIRDVVVVNIGQLIPGDIFDLGVDAVIATGATGDMSAYNSDLTAINRVGFSDDAIYAMGIYADNNAIVGNSYIAAEAAIESGLGAAGAYGIFVDNATVTGSTQTATAASDVGFGFALGINANTDATVTGSTQTATATSTAGLVFALGIFGANDTTVTGSNQTATASSGAGIAQADGISATNNATVTGGTQTAIAISEAGNAEAYGIETDSNDATVIGGIQTATAYSSVGFAQAFGISATNNAKVTGSTQTAKASSNTGAANAFGINAINATVENSHTTAGVIVQGPGSANAYGINADNVATVINGTITSTAIGVGATATGVQGGAGSSVNTTTIIATVNNMNGTKCSSGVASDESCGP